MADKSNTEQAAGGETRSEAAEALERGPRGAMILAGVGVGILFLGWLLFYFVLFMRRGYVG